MLLPMNGDKATRGRRALSCSLALLPVDSTVANAYCSAAPRSQPAAAYRERKEFRWKRDRADTEKGEAGGCTCKRARRIDRHQAERRRSD
jgi:hypothetical protein